MRVVTYESEDRVSVGVCVAGAGVVDVAKLLGESFEDVGAMLRSGRLDELRERAATLAPTTPRLELDALALRPVVLRPEKVLCVGLNYAAHRDETGREATRYPVLFTRFVSTLVGHRQALLRPMASTRFDYEGELAVIIGRRGRRVGPDGALAHVAGYACFNDASVRDWQRHTHQFTPGKNFPATGAVGPWMVTADEIGDPQALTVVTRVNGCELQRGHTRDMLFSVADLIAYISQFCELSPGDIIATGTPSGVGYRRDPPIYLKPGDRVEVEIEGIGTLENPVEDEH